MSSWYTQLAGTLGGMWYSTTRAGMCFETLADGGGVGDGDARCSWRLLETVKRVSKSCSDDSIYSYIEARDKADCFSACHAPSSGSRNTSDECWVRCLFVTILGDGAAAAAASGGLSRSQLLEAWERPFASDDPSLGGCPALALPSPGGGGGAAAGGGGGKGPDSSTAEKVLLVCLLCIAALGGLIMAWRALCRKAGARALPQVEHEERLLEVVGGERTSW